LITRLFKARYFPSSDYLASSIGHKPSFVWRSLWSVKAVVENAFQWSIGSGTNISVWNPSWIRGNHSIPRPADMNLAMASLKVSDLFVPHMKQWHTENIFILFHNSSAYQICRTPLYASVQQNTPVWKLEKNGIYSVRSAYRSIMENSLTVQQHRIDGSWNQLWRIKIPPRIKNFLWRVTRGCLPTRLRLHTRGVVCPLQCPFSSEDEGSAHALFTCHKSAQCWQQMGLWNEVSNVVSNVGNISTTIFEILQQLQSTQHPIFSTLMWSIWKNRNNKVWNDSSDTCQVICDRATTLLLSWRNAQEIKQQGCTRSTPNHVASWTKPSLGRYKCNVDASFSETLDIVGIGMFIRDAEGAFVLARTEWFSPTTDVDIGEAIGLLKAMEWVRDLHLWNMDFEVDSKTVVNNIYGKQIGVSDFSAIITHCVHLLCTDLINSHVKFIRRQAVIPQFLT